MSSAKEEMNSTEQILSASICWFFDPFALAEATQNKPLKSFMMNIFQSYGFERKFKITPDILDNFWERIEAGYNRRCNPYHNSLHATDVTQTVHYMLNNTGIKNWFTELEIFAIILSAAIHDYDHMGTTNNFQVTTSSDLALIYNDRSVQENHHISRTFFLLKEDNCNILSNLSSEEFRAIRIHIIDLVMATDMAFHFQHFKDLKAKLPTFVANKEKSKISGFLLHTCDISNPSKNWDISSRWASRLMEEFFAQGDRERELGLAVSPLCDKYTTLIPESQINFIEFIVEPTFSLFSEMAECVLQSMAEDSSEESGKIEKPWLDCLSGNKKMWKEQTQGTI